MASMLHAAQTTLAEMLARPFGDVGVVQNCDQFYCSDP